MTGPSSGRGSNPSFPQGPAHRVIGTHEPVLVDYHAAWGGYLVDQARIFALGGIDEKFLNAFETALAIQRALTDQGRPGVKADALYQTACDLAAESGLEDRFMGCPIPVSFVGHGIGIEVDELPVISDEDPERVVAMISRQNLISAYNRRRLERMSGAKVVS